MRTLVVSDLHLGSRTDADLLRRPEVRAALVGALEGVDRLVLLGDVLELRHGPAREAVAAAVPLFGEIGRALGPDGQVVISAGNHDHALVAPALERRQFTGEPGLGLETRLGADASEIARALADAATPALTDVVYPGLWIRDDVYATHGHYLDVHVTVPTFERLGAGTMRRLTARGRALTTPEDYEAILAPIYAWLHSVAQYTQTGFGAERQKGTQNAWRMLTASGRRPLKARAAAAAFPVAVAGLNALGLGPVKPDLSPQELRRSGLKAMRQAVRNLGIDADHVLFGHTHRAGPFPHDDDAEWDGLVNTGSWVHERVFLGSAPKKSPYWPGGAVVVDDEGPPRRVNLLPDYVL